MPSIVSDPVSRGDNRTMAQIGRLARTCLDYNIEPDLRWLQASAEAVASLVVRRNLDLAKLDRLSSIVTEARTILGPISFVEGLAGLVGCEQSF